MQRGYRYWLSNAAYIADKIRLNQNITRQAPHIPTESLFRRIWWVLYTWNALRTLNGMDNMRRCRDAERHAPQLTEADWEEEIPMAKQEIFCPVRSADKSYMIESCNLSVISTKVGMIFESYAHAVCHWLTAAAGFWLIFNLRSHTKPCRRLLMLDNANLCMDKATFVKKRSQSTKCLFCEAGLTVEEAIQLAAQLDLLVEEDMVVVG
jgi:hypothetical protein